MIFMNSTSNSRPIRKKRVRIYGLSLTLSYCVRALKNSIRREEKWLKAMMITAFSRNFLRR